MEQVAEGDSDAVVALLARRMGAVERRHLAVASVARLYADAGLPLDARYAACVGLRATWPPPGVPSVWRSALWSAPNVRSLRRPSPRSRGTMRIPLSRLYALAPCARAAARTAASTRRGGHPRAALDDVMSSLAHMAVNRLLKRGGNLDEARVHHALARIYEARLARERSGPPATRWRDDGTRSDSVRRPADPMGPVVLSVVLNQRDLSELRAPSMTQPCVTEPT